MIDEVLVIVNRTDINDDESDTLGVNYVKHKCLQHTIWQNMRMSENIINVPPTCTLEAPCEFASEQDDFQFTVEVRSSRLEGALTVQVVELDAAPSVCDWCEVHDATRGRFLQQV